MKPRRLLGLGALIGFPLAAYVGYPTLVWAAAILRPRPFVTASMYRPTVTVVIAAHNEAALIGTKVCGILNLDYPADRLDCIVACDGCTDDTAAVARAAGDARLRVIELPGQRGKLAAIHAALPHVRGEIIAFTDANATLKQDALSHLVAPFADSAVVVVSGAKQVSNGPEAIYWRYERWIRTRESSSGSVAGADGALYGVRAAAVDASTRTGAADDLLISLRAAKTGGRIVFAPNARTAEAASPGAARAFAARTRTVSGALFALESMPHLLRPGRNDLWWKLTGHKLLRIATPLMMAVGAIVLAGPIPGVRTTAWTAVAGLGPALALLSLRGGDSVRSARRLARYALAANLAALAGLARFIARRPIDAWTPERQLPTETRRSQAATPDQPQI